MLKMRLKSQKSIDYNIFDNKENVVGEVAFNHCAPARKQWIVQLNDEIKFFALLSQATTFVINS